MGLTGKPWIGRGPREHPAQLPPRSFAAANPPCPLPARRACRLTPAELVSSPVDRRRGSRDAASGVTSGAAQYHQKFRIDCSSQAPFLVFCGSEQERAWFLEQLSSPLRRQVFLYSGLYSY